MKNLKFYTVLISLIILVGIFSCGQSANSNSPGKAVSSLFDSMKDKDFKKAAKMYVTKEGNKLSQEEQEKVEGLLAWASSEHDKKDGIDKITIDSEEISEDGNEATVHYTIYFNNGDTSDDKVSVNKIDGDWMVLIN